MMEADEQRKGDLVVWGLYLNEAEQGHDIFKTSTIKVDAEEEAERPKVADVKLFIIKIEAERMFDTGFHMLPDVRWSMLAKK